MKTLLSTRLALAGAVVKNSSQQPNQTSTLRFRSAVFSAIVLATLAVTWPRTAEGQISNGVFASGSSPYGKTYAQ
jgi:hypothetical protein